MMFMEGGGGGGGGIQTQLLACDYNNYRCSDQKAIMIYSTVTIPNCTNNGTQLQFYYLTP